MIIRGLFAFVALGAAVAASAGSYYLALGDSIAYGLEPDSSNPFGYNVPSNGDRGYVAAIANVLGSGASRPTVLNLSLPGESSTSFFDVTDPYGPTNTSYGLGVFDTRTVSQSTFANTAIATYGSSIKTVSFALGANDFLSLQGLKSLTPGDVLTAFGNIQSTYTTVLTDLKTSLPNAKIVLPGYYDPYAVGDPRRTVADPIIQQLNGLIQNAALASGSTYVDFYTPINGHESTLLSTGDIHPNDAGYAALGRAAAQAVPEPSTVAALGLGALALIRRRKA